MLPQQALMSFFNVMGKLITEILFKKKNLHFAVVMAKRHRRCIAGRPKTVKILKTNVLKQEKLCGNKAIAVISKQANCQNSVGRNPPRFTGQTGRAWED